MGQSNFLQALGWAVLNSLWQLAFLWVSYQAIVFLFRIKKSAVKSSLATLLLFSGFGWFIYTFISLLAFNGHPGAATGLIDLEANADLRNWLQATLPVASLIYLALLVLPIVQLFRNYRYVQLVRTTGLSKASLEWRLFVRNVAERMGINKAVKVWVSELVNSPVTVGYLKPVILLPIAAVNQLSPVQMEAIILHELSHIRRYDYLINLITRVIQSVLYFNPFVKAFSTIIGREREKSCDDLVLQFQYEPGGYAAALLTLEKAAAFRVQSLAVAASGSKSSELLQRIESILGISKQPTVSYHRLGAILAGLLCIIAMNCVIILSKPGAAASIARNLRTEPTSLFFNDADDSQTSAGLALVEANPVTVVNHLEPTLQPVASRTSNQHDGEDQDAIAAGIIEDVRFASFTAPEIPELSEEDEQQMKTAFEMSKTVMEQVQWKALEKTIADALTAKEKSIVKTEYQKAIDQIDWNKIENNLRTAYSAIDWNSVNSSLQSAMTEIRLDSIQEAYTLALSNLEDLKQEMEEAKIAAIPDTDITAAALDRKKAAIERSASKLNKVRNRKIVRL